MVEGVVVVVVTIVVMTGGGMVRAMVWYRMLCNMVLNIIYNNNDSDVMLLWLRANVARFTLKMTHFWVALVKNDLKPYNLQGF